MPSLLESNLAEDYHVFTNENYWLQQLGLGSFTTGTLYDFWYQIDPQTGQKDLNRNLFPEDASYDSPGFAFLREQLPSPLDDYAWEASMDVWRFVDSGRGRYENIPDLRDWTFNDANKQRETHYELPFSFSDLELNEFLDVNYLPPSSVDTADTGRLVSIVRPKRLFGPTLDEDDAETVPKGAGLGYASAIVAMNEYMKYYTFKNPDRTEWDKKHLSRLEFLDDVKTSKSGCLNFNSYIIVDVAPGQLDNKGEQCTKASQVTHNLFLFDENQQTVNTKTAIMAVTKHASARRDTTGRVYGSRENGELENVNEKDPSQEVAGDIDLHYNEYTKTWQSGSKTILAKLTTDIPKAQWISGEEDAIEQLEEINIAEVLDNPDGKEYFVLGSGLGMPIVMQNGNPFQWTPNYAATKDCRAEDNKEKAKVQVFNPDDTRTFAKNQTVLLHEVDGLWMPVEFGSGAQDAAFVPPSIFLGRWDFQYMAIPQPYYFYSFNDDKVDGRQDISEAQPKYLTDTYTRFDPLQAEKSFHLEYYSTSFTTDTDDYLLNTGGDQDPVKYSFGANPISLPHWYHQFSSFDYMDQFVGGTRGNARGILGTNYGQTPAGTPIEDPIGNLQTIYFGCSFPDGYETSKPFSLHTNREYDLEPFQADNDKIYNGQTNILGNAGIFCTAVSHAGERMWSDGEQDGDGYWARSAPREGAVEDPLAIPMQQPTPMFAAWENGDYSLKHFPADIATHCSPSGIYGRPIFDAGFLTLLHRGIWSKETTPKYITPYRDPMDGYSVEDRMRKFFFSSGTDLSYEQQQNFFGHGHRVWMFEAPTGVEEDDYQQAYNASIMNSAFDFQPVQQNKIQFRPLRSEVYAALGGGLDSDSPLPDPPYNNFQEDQTTSAKNYLYNIIRTKSNDTKPTMSKTSVERSYDDHGRSARFTNNFTGEAPGFTFSIHDHTVDRNGVGNARSANYNNGVGLGSIPLAFDWACGLIRSIGNRSRRVLGHLWARTDADEIWGSKCDDVPVGQGVAGVIGAVCTVQASSRIEFFTDQVLGLPSFYRSSDNKFVPQWGGSQKDYKSWNTTDLHVRVYQAHPREDLIYDPRTFAVHHFNPGTNLPITRDGSAIANPSIKGIPKTFADLTATVEFADTDGDGKPDCWVDYASTSVDIRVPTYVNAKALAAVQLRWQDEDPDNHPNITGSDVNLRGSEIPRGDVLDPTVVMSDAVKITEDGIPFQPLLRTNFWNVDAKRRGKLLPYSYKRTALSLNTDAGIFFDNNEYYKDGAVYLAKSDMSHPNMSIPTLPEDGIPAHEIDAVVLGWGEGYLAGERFSVRGAEGAVVTIQAVDGDGAVTAFSFTDVPSTGIDPTFLLGSGQVCTPTTKGGASLVPLAAFGKGFDVYFPRALMGKAAVRTDPKPKIASSSDAYQLSLPADNSDERSGAAGGVTGGVAGFFMNFFFGTNQWGGLGGGAIEPSQGNQQTDVDIVPQNAQEEGKYDCFFHFHNDLSHTWLYDDYAYQCRLTDNYIDLRINPI